MNRKVHSTMLTLYFVCAMVGLGIALVAAFMGGHGHDFDSPSDIDISGDTSIEHDSMETGTDSVWLPFLSLRFWTYGLAGFGLVGALLTIFTGTPDSMVLGLAAAMGLLVGTIVSLTVRIAQKQEGSSGVTTNELLGLEGRVMVTIRPGQPGKVRFQAKGDIIDMIAVAEENSTIEMGAKALVVGIEGDLARVIALDAYEEENLYARS